VSFNGKIKTTQGKGISKLLKRLKNPGGVDVGIIDPGKHEGSEFNTAEIGFVHEFGAGPVPERSFMRSTLHEERKDILSLTGKLLKKVVSGKMQQSQALGLIGIDVADKISQKIVKLKAPPNKPGTIDKKGSSNPLVDTGQLKNSITWRVNK